MIDVLVVVSIIVLVVFVIGMGYGFYRYVLRRAGEVTPRIRRRAIGVWILVTGLLSLVILASMYID